jgi:hypothetical protein
VISHFPLVLTITIVVISFRTWNGLSSGTTPAGHNGAMKIIEIRPPKRGFDLISDPLPKKPCGSGGVRVETLF